MQVIMLLNTINQDLTRLSRQVEALAKVINEQQREIEWLRSKVFPGWSEYLDKSGIEAKGQAQKDFTP